MMASAETRGPLTKALLGNGGLLSSSAQFDQQINRDDFFQHAIDTHPNIFNTNSNQIGVMRSVAQLLDAVQVRMRNTNLPTNERQQARNALEHLLITLNDLVNQRLDKPGQGTQALSTFLEQFQNESGYSAADLSTGNLAQLRQDLNNFLSSVGEETGTSQTTLLSLRSMQEALRIINGVTNSSRYKQFNQSLEDIFNALYDKRDVSNLENLNVNVNNLIQQAKSLSIDFNDESWTTAQVSELDAMNSRLQAMSQDISNLSTQAATMLTEEDFNNVSLNQMTSALTNFNEIADTFNNTVHNFVGIINTNETATDAQKLQLIEKCKQLQEENSGFQKAFLEQIDKYVKQRLAIIQQNDPSNTLGQMARSRDMGQQFGYNLQGIGDLATTLVQASYTFDETRVKRPLFGFKPTRAMNKMRKHATIISQLQMEYAQSSAEIKNIHAEAQKAFANGNTRLGNQLLAQYKKQFGSLQTIMETINGHASQIDSTFRGLSKSQQDSLDPVFKNSVKDLMKRIADNNRNLIVQNEALQINADVRKLKQFAKVADQLDELGKAADETRDKSQGLIDGLKRAANGLRGMFYDLKHAGNSILNVFGLGSITLGPISTLMLGNEFHVEQGRKRYASISADLYRGVEDIDASAALSQAQMLAGNELYRISGGRISQYAIRDSYEHMMRNMSGKIDTSPKQFSQDIAYFAENTALLQNVYGLDQTTVTNGLQTLYRDMRMSASQAANAFAKLTQQAISANIPIDQYLSAFNEIAKQYMSIGITGERAGIVLDNLAKDRIRIDIAKEVARQLGQSLATFSQDKNKVAFSAVMQGRNPWEAMASMAYTHDRNGDPREGFVDEAVSLADTYVNTMLSAYGNDEDMRRIGLTDIFKQQFQMDQRTASILADDYLKNGNTEQFKRRFEEAAKKADNPNAGIEELNDKILDQLQKMAGQLATGDKLEAYLRSQIFEEAQNIGAMIDDILKAFKPLLLAIQGTMIEVTAKIVDWIKELVTGDTFAQAREYIVSALKYLPIAFAAFFGVVFGGKIVKFIWSIVSGIIGGLAGSVKSIIKSPIGRRFLPLLAIAGIAGAVLNSDSLPSLKDIDLDNFSVDDLINKMPFIGNDNTKEGEKNKSLSDIFKNFSFSFFDTTDKDRADKPKPVDDSIIDKAIKGVSDLDILNPNIDVNQFADAARTLTDNVNELRYSLYPKDTDDETILLARAMSSDDPQAIDKYMQQRRKHFRPENIEDPSTKRLYDQANEFQDEFYNKSSKKDKPSSPSTAETTTKKTKPAEDNETAVLGTSMEIEDQDLVTPTEIINAEDGLIYPNTNAQNIQQPLQERNNLSNKPVAFTSANDNDDAIIKQKIQQTIQQASQRKVKYTPEPFKFTVSTVKDKTPLHNTQDIINQYVTSITQTQTNKSVADMNMPTETHRTLDTAKPDVPDFNSNNFKMESISNFFGNIFSPSRAEAAELPSDDYESTALQTDFQPEQTIVKDSVTVVSPLTSSDAFVKMDTDTLFNNIPGKQNEHIINQTLRQSANRYSFNSATDQYLFEAKRIIRPEQIISSRLAQSPDQATVTLPQGQQEFTDQIPRQNIQQQFEPLAANSQYSFNNISLLPTAQTLTINRAINTVELPNIINQHDSNQQNKQLEQPQQILAEKPASQRDEKEKNKIYRAIIALRDRYQNLQKQHQEILAGINDVQQLRNNTLSKLAVASENNDLTETKRLTSILQKYNEQLANLNKRAKSTEKEIDDAAKNLAEQYEKYEQNAANETKDKSAALPGQVDTAEQIARKGSEDYGKQTRLMYSDAADSTGEHTIATNDNVVKSSDNADQQVTEAEITGLEGVSGSIDAIANGVARQNKDKRKADPNAPEVPEDIGDVEFDKDGFIIINDDDNNEVKQKKKRYNDELKRRREQQEQQQQNRYLNSEQLEPSANDTANQAMYGNANSTDDPEYVEAIANGAPKPKAARPDDLKSYNKEEIQAARNKAKRRRNIDEASKCNPSHLGETKPNSATQFTYRPGGITQAEINQAAEQLKNLAAGKQETTPAPKSMKNKLPVTNYAHNIDYTQHMKQTEWSPQSTAVLGTSMIITPVKANDNRTDVEKTAHAALIKKQRAAIARITANRNHLGITTVPPIQVYRPANVTQQEIDRIRDDQYRRTHARPDDLKGYNAEQITRAISEGKRLVAIEHATKLDTRQTYKPSAPTTIVAGATMYHPAGITQHDIDTVREKHQVQKPTSKPPLNDGDAITVREKLLLSAETRGIDYSALPFNKPYTPSDIPNLQYEKERLKNSRIADKTAYEKAASVANQQPSNTNIVKQSAVKDYSYNALTSGITKSNKLSTPFSYQAGPTVNMRNMLDKNGLTQIVDSTELNKKAVEAAGRRSDSGDLPAQVVSPSSTPSLRPDELKGYGTYSYKSPSSSVPSSLRPDELKGYGVYKPDQPGSLRPDELKGYGAYKSDQPGSLRPDDLKGYKSGDLQKLKEERERLRQQQQLSRQDRKSEEPVTLAARLQSLPELKKLKDHDIEAKRIARQDRRKKTPKQERQENHEPEPEYRSESDKSRGTTINDAQRKIEKEQKAWQELADKTIDLLEEFMELDKSTLGDFQATVTNEHNQLLKMIQITHQILLDITNVVGRGNVLQAAAMAVFAQTRGGGGTPIGSPGGNIGHYGTSADVTFKRTFDKQKILEYFKIHKNTSDFTMNDVNVIIKEAEANGLDPAFFAAALILEGGPRLNIGNVEHKVNGERFAPFSSFEEGVHESALHYRKEIERANTPNIWAVTYVYAPWGEGENYNYVPGVGKIMKEFGVPDEQLQFGARPNYDPQGRTPWNQLKQGNMTPYQTAPQVPITPGGGGQAANANIEQMVRWAEQIAADDTHGYSKSNREGNPDYDCSSFVYHAAQQAGFNVIEKWRNNPRFQAGVDGKVYAGKQYSGDADTFWEDVSKLGGWQKIPYNEIQKYGGLQRGDVLGRRDGSYIGHLAIYAGNGKIVHASTATGNGGSTAPGDQGGEILVSDLGNRSFAEVYRYTGGGTVTPPAATTPGPKIPNQQGGAQLPQPNAGLAGKRIVINPGHMPGVPSDGAPGEPEMNLLIADKLVAYLQKMGVDAVKVHWEPGKDKMDNATYWRELNKLINNENPSFVLFLHHDQFGVRGAHAGYNTGDERGKQLALAIPKEISQGLGLPITNKIATGDENSNYHGMVSMKGNWDRIVLEMTGVDDPTYLQIYRNNPDKIVEVLANALIKQVSGSPLSAGPSSGGQPMITMTTEQALAQIEALAQQYMAGPGLPELHPYNLYTQQAGLLPADQNLVIASGKVDQDIMQRHQAHIDEINARYAAMAEEAESEEEGEEEEEETDETDETGKKKKKKKKKTAAEIEQELQQIRENHRKGLSMAGHQFAQEDIDELRKQHPDWGLEHIYNELDKRPEYGLSNKDYLKQFGITVPSNSQLLESLIAKNLKQGKGPNGVKFDSKDIKELEAQGKTHNEIIAELSARQKYSFKSGSRPARFATKMNIVLPSGQTISSVTSLSPNGLVIAHIGEYDPSQLGTALHPVYTNVEQEHHMPVSGPTTNPIKILQDEQRKYMETVQHEFEESVKTLDKAATNSVKSFIEAYKRAHPQATMDEARDAARKFIKENVTIDLELKKTTNEINKKLKELCGDTYKEHEQLYDELVELMIDTAERRARRIERKIKEKPKPATNTEGGESGEQPVGKPDAIKPQVQ